MKNSKYNKDWTKLLVYDESSPSCLVWKEDRYRGNQKAPYVFVCAGEPAGARPNSSQRYWTLNMSVDGEKSYWQIHRIIYQMHFGDFINELDIVDHKDGDRNNNKISNLRLIPKKLNSRNAKLYKNNSQGVVGVYFEDSPSGGRYKAMWMDLDNVQRSKSFSVGFYGEGLANFLAMEYRKHQIDLLNILGAGYTNRHGLKLEE